MKNLAKDEVIRELTSLPVWRIEEDKLYREFEFDSFPRAFGFMTSVAIICQSMNHHPEWLNVYTSVKVWLSSHEVNGISNNDFELARQMNALFDPAKNE